MVSSSVDFDVLWLTMIRPLIEDSLRLDLAHPEIRRVIGAGVARNGVFEWGDDDVAASVGYSWRPGARVLELRFRAAGVSARQAIRLLVTPTPFGGHRLWFECPDTLVRARALFLPPGRRHWAGREAHRLAYSSQQARPNVFTRFVRDLDCDDAHNRRNGVRRLRWGERKREAARLRTPRTRAFD